MIKSQLGEESSRECAEGDRRWVDNELTIHSSLPEAGDGGSPLCQRGQWHCQNAPLFSLPAELRCANGGWQVHRRLLSTPITFLPFATVHHARPAATSSRAGEKGAPGGGDNKFGLLPSCQLLRRRASKSAVTPPRPSWLDTSQRIHSSLRGGLI